MQLLKDTPAGSIGVSEAVRDNLKECCHDTILQPVDWVERVLHGQKYRSYRVTAPSV